MGAQKRGKKHIWENSEVLQRTWKPSRTLIVWMSFLSRKGESSLPSRGNSMCKERLRGMKKFGKQRKWWEQLVMINIRGVLEQGSAILFFLKGTESKYLRLWQAIQSCHNYSPLPWKHKSSHKQYMNKWAWLCSNKTLFTKAGSSLNLAHRLQFNNSYSEDKMIKAS